MNKLAAGASKAHNGLITDIMKHLEDKGARPGFGEGGLKNFLLEKIGDLTREAYKKSFRRGHRESYGAFSETGKVPKKLKCEVTRSLAPKQKRTIKCKSTLPQE